MVIRVLIVIFAVFALAGAARAENEPIFEPVPDWVDAVERAEPDPARGDQAFQTLLSDSQSRYTSDGEEHFVHFALLIQNPQGLSATGTLTIPWQPDRRELIVHYVRIIRDGEVIDVLANGQEFIVLRRENNLELATLNGVLTAVIQPEGLAVGDIVSLAYSTRSRPNEIDYRAENLFVTQVPVPIRRYSIRQIWDDEIPMEWRLGDAMGQARVIETDLGREFLLSGEDIESPEAIEFAPQRYQFPMTLQLSAYQSWSNISRLFAPYYQQAAELREESPLLAQIEEIAAAHSSPEDRAVAALRLVQDRVRYVALQMGNGGHIPASADQTWARRFGDCKGKTSLLLALLHGLNIQAEPALVSSQWGDGLDGRLPQLYLFDHVIVRATIGGQVYWLDGTRLGDVNLGDLRSSQFSWALPIRSEGADLEELPLYPPSSPLSALNIVYDASNGVSREIPFSGTAVYRGDGATLLSNNASQLTDEQLQQFVEQSDLNLSDDATISDISYTYDSDEGTFTIAFEGQTDLSWVRAPNGAGMRFRFNESLLDWEYDFQRDDSAENDIPFSLNFPVYGTMVESIILPNSGNGFSLDGEDIEQTLGGSEYMRRLVIENGVARSETSVRRIVNEIAAEEARQDYPEMEMVSDSHAYVIASADSDVAQAEIDNLRSVEPGTAQEFFRRAAQFLQAEQFEEGLADLDEAERLDPNLENIHRVRAMALMMLGRGDEAETALDLALEEDPDDLFLLRGKAALLLSRAEGEQALPYFTQIIDGTADTAELAELYAERASAFDQSGRLEESLADLESALAINPGDDFLLWRKARILFALGHNDQIAAIFAQIEDPAYFDAIADFYRAHDMMPLADDFYRRAMEWTDSEITAAETDSVDEMRLQSTRAQLLADTGHVAESLQILESLLEDQVGDTVLLNQLCWTRMVANIELETALANCEEAIGNDPENGAIIDSRAWVKLRLRRYDEAIADFDLALELLPGMVSSIYGRALALIHSGDSAGGLAELDLARRHAFDIDTQYGFWLGDLMPPAEPENPETIP